MQPEQRHTFMHTHSYHTDRETGKESVAIQNEAPQQTAPAQTAVDKPPMPSPEIKAGKVDAAARVVKKKGSGTAQPQAAPDAAAVPEPFSYADRRSSGRPDKPPLPFSYGLYRASSGGKPTLLFS